MKKTISKTEAKNQIEKFFENIDSKTPKEVKKIKRLAMSYNIPLKEKRKLFCGKCLAPYKDARIRLKNNMLTIVCGNCGKRSRWKIKN